MAQGFVHLHTHSSHSVRDSIARPDDLFDAVVADGQSALAITDHGSLSGLYVAHQSAAKRGVSLIGGIEAYMAIEDGESNARLRREIGRKSIDDSNASDTSEPGESKYTHLTLLAENEVGLKNLMRLSALSHEGDAFWSRPRMDLSLLAENSEGLIALSGCLGGAIKSRLALGDTDGANAAARDLLEIFGKDNFFIEVMSHGIAIEDSLNADLLDIAKCHDLRVVATNDSHFTSAEDSHAHDAWLCGASGKTIDDPKRWRFTGSGFHLRSAQAMRAIFDDQPGFEDACDNTLLIAERASGYSMFPKHGLRIPTFDPTNERSASELLHEKVKAGAIRRYSSPLPGVVKERLRYELDIISNAGLSDYFLIVADMIDWAKAQGIRVGPGRGSAAGSCVSFCMGIIAVDPLAHGLLFERFLNPTRNKMPDIDTDFEQGRRQEVVNYLIERWGKDSVGLIGTLGYSLSKNSLRVAGKVLGSSQVGVALANQVPTLGDGKTASIQALRDPGWAPGAGFRELAAESGSEPVIEIAKRFEGVVNTESIHPCGVVIGDEELVGLIPLRSDRRTEKSGGTGGWVSEFDGEALEDLGFLKMDILGLANLDVVEAAVREIKRRHGIDLDVDTIPDTGTDEAKKAWTMVGAGRTEGIFQIEGQGTQDLARRLRPASVDELAVLIALYRPGPLGIGMHDMYADRRAGLEKISYDIFTKIHAEVEILASVMDETLAVMVYQEQLLRIAELVAGFNPPERDNLLRAIGKKDREKMNRSGELFIKGAQANVDMAGEPKLAFAARTAENLWEAMKSAGEYSFNKSHSVGYARLSFITAWLKANYPTEYAAGWLSISDNQEKRLAFLASLREEGVELRHPDVNRSDAYPTVGDDGVVLFGLSKIRDVGTVAAEIVAERTAHGPFKSLADFASRVRVTNGTRRVSITVLRALIESGAFDAFGTRKGMFDALETLRKNPGATVSKSEWGVLEYSVRERDRLGILVSADPLSVFKDQIKTWRSPQTRSVPVALHRLPDEGNVSTIGLVTSWEVLKRKTSFAKMRLSGTKSTIDCVIWNTTLDKIVRSGMVPKVGDIIGIDGIVKTKTPYQRDTDEGTDTEEVSVKELVVNSIWSFPINDETAVVDDTAPDAPTLFDKPRQERLAVAAKSVASLDDVVDAIELEFIDPSEYDDDGFDYPAAEKPQAEARSLLTTPAPSVASTPQRTSLARPTRSLARTTIEVHEFSGFRRIPRNPPLV
jgi:DNA polymerase-3 subunit alpha